MLGLKPTHPPGTSTFRAKAAASGGPRAPGEAARGQKSATASCVHVSGTGGVGHRSTALVAVQKAIEKAGSIEPARVRDALASLDIMTFYGPIKFQKNGMNADRGLPIIQVQGGTVKVLYPPALQQAGLVAVK